jgi:hypothetical protein
MLQTRQAVAAELTMGLSELDTNINTLYVISAPESSMPKLTTCRIIWKWGGESAQCRVSETPSGRAALDPPKASLRPHGGQRATPRQSEPVSS